MKNEALYEKSCLLLFIYISHEASVHPMPIALLLVLDQESNPTAISFQLEVSICISENKYVLQIKEYLEPTSQNIALKSCHSTESTYGVLRTVYVTCCY